MENLIIIWNFREKKTKMPHPNSLMYNAYPIPFWPMKMYWTLKKV
jgi:hypothetical protein